MKTQTIDPRTKRLSVLVAVLAGLVLLGAAAYTFMGNTPQKPANGMKILAAGHSYVQDLKKSKTPIPPAVSLQYLVDKKYLQPEDLGSLQGVDATLSLLGTNGMQNVLMRAKLPDGTEFVLMADGSSPPPPPKK